MNTKNSLLKSNNKKSKIRQSNRNINIKCIRSNYILKQIFEHLCEKCSLELIKYNKDIQKILDINIDNYKLFSQLYSTIELEIKVIERKKGNFIYIEEEKDKPYFHIYFNDNLKEIKKEIKMNLQRKIKYQK